MFNCKKLFKLQIRPPSLILLITISQDRWIFPSQSWEVRNLMMMMMMMMIIIIIIIIINVLCGSKMAAQVIPIVILVSSTGVIPKSLSQSLTTLNLHPNTYIHTAAKICNSWHMFNCKKLFKLQIRPPSLILLITTSWDRWIFPSQSWEVRNSIMMMITKGEVTANRPDIIIKNRKHARW